MAFVFSSARGVVKRVDSRRPTVPFRVNINGAQFQRAIITQAAVVQNDNYQFLHTLADTIYVYIFGTRIGELTVSGLAFAELCDTGSDGPTEVFRWYRDNRISQRREEIQVVFGDTPFDCFLTGMSAQITDAENILTQWTYRFSVFPEA